ncbi:hypothetical protein JCM1840_007285 [Sporobolomyces johnsonii]
MVNPRVFMDFQVEGQQIGRVIFELFADTVPKTAENFRALCTGSSGLNELGIPLWYKGSPLHRIISGFMVQGGDFTLRNGKGGESIYGASFEDEDLKREVDAEGLLVMANKGRNTNNSQFFVSLRPCPHLNGKHVVFGRVVKGYEVIVAMSKLPVDSKDHPLQLVTISHCGELERKAKVVQRAPSPSPSVVSSRSRSASVSSSRSRTRSPSPDHKRSRRHRSSRSRSRRHDDDDDDERDSAASSADERSHRKRRSSSRKKDHHHKSSSRRHHRSSRRQRDSRSRSPDRKERSLVEQQPTEEDLGRKRVEEEEAERRRAEEERQRLEREREAAARRERYEKEVLARGGTILKGRGAMKAPGEGGRSAGMRGW